MRKLAWLLLLAGSMGMSAPQTGYYGYLKGDGYPLLTPNGTIDSLVADSIAWYDHVILDAPAPKQRPDILRALRQRNPDIKLYAYILEDVYWVNPHPALGDTTSDLPWHVWQAIRGNGGPLISTSGISLGVNVANRQQMWAIADTYIHDVVQPGLWDGLFVDVACPRTWGTQFGDQAVDLARMGFRTPEEFNAAWSKGSDLFISVLRSACGDSFPIIGNCGPSGQAAFSGWMRENFPWQGIQDPENGWQENMLVNSWNQPGYLMDSLTYSQPTFSWLAWEPGYAADAPETQRRARFTLGSSCLGLGTAAVGRHEWEHPRYWWFAEYGAPGSHWLGEPLEPGREVRNGLWSRRFQHGLVVVNPTWIPQSIYLTQSYRPIRGGAWKRAFVVPARDARFLRK